MRGKDAPRLEASHGWDFSRSPQVIENETFRESLLLKGELMEAKMTPAPIHHATMITAGGASSRYPGFTS